MEQSEEEENGKLVQFGRLIGILVMCFVAFNDGMLAVLARKMRDLHFSIMMFWFSTIGMLVLSIFLICSGLVKHEIPQVFRYDLEQYYYWGMTGLFSALNLTCLTIAY